MTFDGFMSYSHAADGRLAPAVHRGLHRLGKPWHRRRALWIFRDQTGLSVTPALWSSIQKALDSSEYFVLLASPESARSHWVNREIEHWVATKSTGQILPVLTDGEWRWDPQRGDFAEDSTAVPDALRGVFAEEPLYLDLRWARDDQHLSLQHSRFRDAIAQLAAPMHGLSKDELESEDVRQYRRARRLRSMAATVLVVLTLVASLTGVLAVRNADQATVAAAEARHQQRVASEQRGNAERSAEESRRQQHNARTHEQRARDAAKETQRQQGLTREQQGLAERAAAEATSQQGRARQLGQRAQRQQQLAKRAVELARQQKALAQEQAELAVQSAQGTSRQKIIALEQQHLAEKATEDARQQRQNALQQQRLAEMAAAEARRQEHAAREQERRARAAAEEARRAKAAADQQQRIATGRRLINQAKATMDNDPATALMLGVAAQQFQPDAEARRELTGMVTSTRYAGALSDVEGVAYGPDNILATVDSDFHASLWNVADRTNPVRISRMMNKRAIGWPTFSPDGRTLAVIELEPGHYYAPVLWDVANPANPVLIGRLSADDDLHVPAVTFSPDGRSLVTAGLQSWTLWDLADRHRPRVVSTQPGQDLAGAGVAFSPDGRTMVTTDGTARIWDITDRTDPAEVGTLDGHWTGVVASPTTPVVATRHYDGTLTMWSIRDPQEPQKIITLHGQRGAVMFSPDGAMLASGDDRGATVLRDLTTLGFPQIASLTAHGGVVETIAFSPEGRTLATLGIGATATLWNVADHGAAKLIGNIDTPKRTMMSVVLGKDGRSLKTVDSKGTVVVWDVTNPASPVPRDSTSVQTAGVSDAAFSPGGDIVATVGSEGSLTLTNISDLTRPKRLGVLPPNPDLDTLALSPDGRTLAVGTDSELLLWDVPERGEPVHLATVTMDQWVKAITWSPDSGTVAVGVGDSVTVTMWDVADRSAPSLMATMNNGDLVNAVAFSPDGDTLAIGSDHRAVLWNVADRTRPRKRATLTGHHLPVWSFAFAADGRTLATGDEFTALLWDIDELTEPTRIATLRHSTLSTGMLMFLADGHTLAAANAGGYDTPSTLWSFAELKEMRANPATRACAITGRGLTADEWSGYLPGVPYQSTCPR